MKNSGIELSLKLQMFGIDVIMADFWKKKPGNSQRKNAAILDTDDDNSSVSSSSTTRSDRFSVMDTDEMQLDRDTLLDQALDALYEKR